MAVAFGAVFLMVWFVYVTGRWSAEDNGTECYYESQKLVVHVRNDPTNEIGSNLVFACMKAKRFNFDFITAEKYDRRFRAEHKKYNLSDERNEEDAARYRNGLYLAWSYWHRDWSRYLPF